MAAPADMLSFLRVVGRLKRVQRAGWVLCGVPAPESVADHMYRMSIMCLALAPARRERVMKMALVHDLAEAVVGDITPHDGVSASDKQARERAALKKILAPVGEGLREEIAGLWEEYEKGESEDAVLVKDVDKFEMVLQADEYEEADGRDLQQFFDSTEGRFRTEVVRGMDRELREQRERRRKEEKKSTAE